MLRKLLINLERRPERLALHDIEAQNMQVVKAVDGSSLTKEQMMNAPVRKNWRDPWQNRRFTKGEYGCFASHIECWKIVAEQNEPMLICEDDVIFTPYYDETFLKNKLGPGVDFILLGYNENYPQNIVYHGDGFLTPGFPYNTHAYILDPVAARKLLNLTKTKDFSMIPLDDWFSERLAAGELNIVACEMDMANQQPRDAFPSDVDANTSPYFENFNIHVLTCSTDDWKAYRLFESAEKHGISITNIGKGVEWKGTDMSGPGGGQKLNLLQDYIKDVPDTDIVFFVDGYDVFFTDNLNTIMDRWFSFNRRALFGAEKYCWPDTSIALQFPEQETAYKYLNSGTFIAEVETLRQILSDPVADFSDDQLYVQKKYLEGSLDIGIDSEQFIFQVYDESVGKNAYNQIVNYETSCTGCLFHGNGGEAAKRKLDQLYKLFSFTNDMFIEPQFVRNIEKDMLEVSFLSEEGCKALIDIAEAQGTWEPLPDDLFPAQEIRLKELGLLPQFEAFWTEHIAPVVEKYWHPIKMYGVRDAFVMKYTPETQNKLALHHDASLVTGSVKLNDNYEGGRLYYPRQDKSNDSTPVGKCILFPGQVTHGHKCEEITRGTKYSLTIWTSRYDGDVM